MSRTSPLATDYAPAVSRPQHVGNGLPSTRRAPIRDRQAGQTLAKAAAAPALTGALFTMHHRSVVPSFHTLESVWNGTVYVLGTINTDPFRRNA